MGRYLSFLQMCTLSTIRNLRFPILLKALALNVTLSRLGEHNIMPRILSDPYLDKELSGTHRICQKYKDFEILNK